MKFKNYIEVQSGIKDSANLPGTLDQVLTSTATGVAWVDPSTISAKAATLVVIECKNTSGATITKGTPVYQTGTVGATDVIEIAPADALISAGSQPAIGLLQTTLNDNGFGKVVITGELLNFTTDPIDGVTPTTGDKIFLKSGGGLTLTKPTGAGNAIQNLGLIGKVSGGSAGSITVASIMRANDVPNLPTGKIWVGDSNTIVSDTVFLDEPNGRMGINTTTPTKDLEIGTNAAAETEFRMHSDESGKYFNIQSAGNFTSVKTAGSQNFILDSSGTAGYITMVTNASERVRVNYNGNVGIGTTSPSTKLHVQGAASGYLFRVQGTSVLNVYDPGAAAEIGVGSGSGDKLKLFSNDSLNNGITIDTSGNVGIGTTSPSHKLDVAGDIKLTNSNSIYWRNAANNADIPLLNLSSTNIFNVGTTSSSVPVQIALHTAGSEKMRITSDGKVGIGTTSPGAKLEVSSTSGWGLFTERGIKDGSTSTYSHSYGAGNAHILGRAMYFENVAVFSTSTADATTKEYRFKNSADKLIIESLVSGGITDSNILVLSGSNVGIGTSSPNQKLEVSGNSLVTGTQFIGDTFTKIQQASGNLLLTNQSLSGAITFLTNSTEQVRITSSGNVGIGTTSPIYKLDVVSSGTATARLKSAGTGAISLRYENGGGFKSAAVVDNNGLYRLDATNISLNPTNNVGIGTTSPQTKLQVEYTDTHTSGDLALANSAFDIYNDSTTDVAGKGSTITFSDNYLGTNKTTRAAIKGGTDTAGNTADGFLAFYTDSSSANSMQQRMIINHDGRVSFNYYGSGSFTGTATQRLAVDTSGNVIEIPIGSGPVDGSGTANYSARWIDTDTLGIGTLYDNGTNVGIGTTSPTHNLHIASDAPVIRLQDNTSSDDHYLNGNNGEFRIQTTGFLTLRPGNTESVRFLANGNVGINDTNPIKKLQVNGQTKFYEHSGAHLTNQATSNFNFETLANNTASTSGGSVGAFIKLTATPPGATSTWSTFRARAYGENTKGNTDGMITFFSEYRNYTSINAVTLNYHAGLYVNPLGVGGLATVTNNYGVFLNPGTTATNNYGVYQNGSSVKNFFQGNVGIGTTSPNAKLNVNGNVKIEGTNPLYFGGSGSVPNWEIKAYGSGGNDLLINDTGTNSGDLIFTGQDFGVGTTNPSEKLHVSGEPHPSIRLSSSSDSNYNVVINCGYRNEALNLSVGGYKVFTTEGYNTPETTHLYSNNSKALSLASNQAATFTSTVTATNFINSSDERLKENIEKVRDNSLDVKWKTFEFKSDKGQKRYGVIAQELEKTNPEFVREDDQGFKSVAYIDLLIAKIAELEARIQKLENK